MLRAEPVIPEGEGLGAVSLRALDVDSLSALFMPSACVMALISLPALHVRVRLRRLRHGPPAGARTGPGSAATCRTW